MGGALSWEILKWGKSQIGKPKPLHIHKIKPGSWKELFEKQMTKRLKQTVISSSNTPGAKCLPREPVGPSDNPSGQGPLRKDVAIARQLINSLYRCQL